VRKLIVHGNVVSLKNSKQLFVNSRTGKHFITSSVASKQWVKDSLWQLKGVKPVTDYPTGVTMVFYFKGKHRKDLDNVCSSVMDVLRDSGILVDDDYTHVDTINLQFGGIDKSDPRVEIYLDD